MKGIIPHLWFDTQTQEAVELYTRLFDRSKITYTQVMEDTPSGDATSVSFELVGQPFMAINGGPYFKLNPSLSLMVLCSTKEEVDKLWEELSADGRVLMPLDEYPFSNCYGWVQDRFGLTWQLDWTEEPIRQKIVPTFLFSKEAAGKAEEALAFYAEVFPQAEVEEIFHYAPEEASNAHAKVQFAAFRLFDMQFYAMDNGMDTLGETDLHFNKFPKEVSHF